MYIGIPHLQTHPYLPCQGTVERISLAKCHSSHRFYGMMNASRYGPCGMRVYPLCGCTGSSLAIHPRLEKKRFQWLLPVPTKRNLKVVAATMIQPVPLSPSSTVNWSRGNVMSICVQRLTITKTVRCEGLWRIHNLPSQPNCIPPSSARHSMRSMQFVYRSQFFSSGESQFTQNGDIRVSLWIEDNSSMAGP